MKKEELAYSAGLFDGEGCVSIERMGGKQTKTWKRKYYRLVVDVVSTSFDLVKFLHKRFGGSIFEYNSAKRCSTWKKAYRWRLGPTEAENFLRKLLPYLIYKKKHAELALRYREEITHRKKFRDSVLLDKAEFYKNELSKLNH